MVDDAVNVTVEEVQFICAGAAIAALGSELTDTVPVPVALPQALPE